MQNEESVNDEVSTQQSSAVLLFLAFFFLCHRLPALPIASVYVAFYIIVCLLFFESADFTHI